MKMDLIRVITAVVLPPLGVFLQEGLGTQFWINLILFFVIPYFGGLIHALYVILKEND